MKPFEQESASAEIPPEEAEAVFECFTAILPILKQGYKTMERVVADHPKWVHLYRYAKKARIRKKYERLVYAEWFRIMKEAEA